MEVSVCSSTVATTNVLILDTWVIEQEIIFYLFAFNFYLKFEPWYETCIVLDRV